MCILFFSLFVGLVSDLRHCLFVLCVCCYFFQHLLQASHGCLCDQRGRPLKDVIEDLPIVFVFEPLVPLLAGASGLLFGSGFFPRRVLLRLFLLLWRPLLVPLSWLLLSGTCSFGTPFVF